MEQKRLQGSLAPRQGANGAWDLIVDRVADFPFGLVVFVVLIGLKLFGVISADDLRTLGVAAGLFGIGHGIRTGTERVRWSV